MGTVYLASDRKHDRRVAIKVLPPDLASALGPERFLREIRIAARLNHPHILPLHDSGQAAGMLYYVMPHVEGESLRSRLSEGGQVPVAEALEITRQLADALDHAHAAGVVHRDVKPENILLTGYPPRGEGAVSGRYALLADFGVAKALQYGGAADGPGRDFRTDSGLPLGTAAYASPEQAAGSREIDGRSDIYSLGCVLYEMLAAEPPAGGPTVVQILEKRFAEPMPPIRSLRPEVPEWAERALIRALSNNPADRYATAAEFRAALTGSATTTESPTGAPQVQVPRRRQLLWMTAGAAALALVAAAVAFLPRRAPGTDPKRVVVAGFENRTGDSALAPVGDIASDYIARGLAATRLMHDVYDIRTAAGDAGEPVRVGATAGRALAKRLGAGTVLWGSYYRDGDSLHFEAQLVDAPTGRVIMPLEPAVGLVRERTRVVETLRQRVMAGFAVVLGPDFDAWKTASLPPTYEAYQEMLAARHTGFDFHAAAEHYRRAAALDTSFTGALTSRAVVEWLQGACPSVDSIARRLEPRKRLLPPTDRGQLDLASASCRGDTDEALDAVRAALEAAPRSAYFTILGAVIAVEHLRPRESLEILRRLDPEAVGLEGDALDLYRYWLLVTYHMLGDYEQELKTAHGKSTSALAALGRVEEAERMAIGDLPRQHSADDPWPVPMATECAALELRAHGHPEAARRVFERVITWYGAAGVSDATRDDFPCAQPHFNAFYYTGRWTEARAGYQQRLAEDTTDQKAHAALGALAVRRGDRAEADRMDAWLAGRPENPRAVYSRARMAALGGDRERAVALVRRALELGLRYRMYLHLDPDFESLREYPPYQELVRRKE